ncbi:MAG TPA: anti-sigma factor [Chthonomonadales bacterium]|nr:anti-sigma factor [Chthonomonadales bacterium]
MSCGRAGRLLSAFIDDELPGSEKLAVRDHLRGCLTCRSEYDSLVATKRLLSGLSTSEPRPEFEGELLRRLHLVAEMEPPSPPPLWSRLFRLERRPVARRALALAAGAAFAALAVGLSRPQASDHAGVQAANLGIRWTPPAAPAPHIGDMLFLHDEGAPFIDAEPASFEPIFAPHGPTPRVSPVLDSGAALRNR